jgi:restriction system protein
VNTLRQFPEFKEASKSAEISDAAEPTASAGHVEGSETQLGGSPEELLIENFTLLEKALVSDILDEIAKMSPRGFEEFAMILFKKIYGGPTEDAGTVVGKPADGGIDVIIEEDELGLDKIHVQVKHWQGVVGSPELMKFSGALTGIGSNRGIFVTQSTFSKEAKKYVEGLPQRIVLVDGERLARLMIDHSLGVTTKEVYRVKHVDRDYFESFIGNNKGMKPATP